MHRLLALVVLVPAVAMAAPRLTIGTNDATANVSKASLVLVTYVDHTRAVLTLDLTTDRIENVEASTAFDVPHGARVVEMAFTLGDLPPAAAKTMDERDARETYDEVVRRAKDPALLHLVAAGITTDRYALHVYPLRADLSPRVEIEIELPVAASLELASAQPIANLAVTLDGSAQSVRKLDGVVEIAVPTTTNVARGPRTAAIDRKTSLFADEPPRWSPRALDLLPGRTSAVDALGAPLPPQVIRHVAQKNFGELNRCVALGQSGSANTPVDLTFVVLPNGRVAAVSVDGVDSAMVRACITRNVETWVFKERDQSALASVAMQLR